MDDAIYKTKKHVLISLSTLVLNSRDRYEKKWLPNFTRLKTRLRISNI